MASLTVWIEFTKGWKLSRKNEAVGTNVDGLASLGPFFNIDALSTVPNPE